MVPALSRILGSERFDRRGVGGGSRRSSSSLKNPNCAGRGEGGGLLRFSSSPSPKNSDCAGRGEGGGTGRESSSLPLKLRCSISAYFLVDGDE